MEDAKKVDEHIPLNKHLLPVTNINIIDHDHVHQNEHSFTDFFTGLQTDMEESASKFIPKLLVRLKMNPCFLDGKEISVKKRQAMSDFLNEFDKPAELFIEEDEDMFVKSQSDHQTTFDL